jgi:hypothetical protein
MSFAVVFQMALTAAVSADQRGQLPPPPLPVDPTPLTELISASELQELARAADPKKQVQALLAITTSHLDAAHSAIKDGNFRKAERELDIYNKANIKAVDVALSLPKGRQGVAKKIEQLIFKHIKTLETIERLFPAERIAFAEAALGQAKEQRIRALHAALDSGDVLDVPDKEKGDGKPDQEGSHPSAHTLVPVGFKPAILQRRSSLVPGDYLNEEEDDHVREAQEADERIKVFMKIADRRLQAINPPTVISATDKKAQKKAEEELREWGPLPQGTKSELLRHYARAIEEAIAKLEDAHERNPKSTSIPKALTLLRDSTDRHLQTLRPMEATAKDEDERDAVRNAISQAEWANKGAREGLKG